MPNPLQNLISNAENLHIFTGAGVSVDAGIPDFQSTDDDWAWELPRAELLSRPYFQQNPTRFWEVYRNVFTEKLLNHEPTRFHRWVADLETAGHNVTVTTQNVDGLHTKAGSTNVIEVHGNIRDLLCTRDSCKYVTSYESRTQETLPHCETCNSILTPAVSLFGDGIHGYMDSMRAAEASDLMIIAGTALDVGPINQIPLEAEVRWSKRMLWLNKDEPQPPYRFTHKFVDTMDVFMDYVTE